MSYEFEKLHIQFRQSKSCYGVYLMCMDPVLTINTGAESHSFLHGEIAPNIEKCHYWRVYSAWAKINGEFYDIPHLIGKPVGEIMPEVKLITSSGILGIAYVMKHLHNIASITDFIQSAKNM